MKNKHTPSPWKFCNDTLCQATGNYLHLGTFVDSPGLGHATKANRSLIESAPDLLEALENAIPIIDAYRRVSGGDGDLTALSARRAIAKATGDNKKDEGPSLLEALKGLHDATKAYFQDFEHLHPIIRNRLAQARLAIDKAST